VSSITWCVCTTTRPHGSELYCCVSSTRVCRTGERRERTACTKRTSRTRPPPAKPCHAPTLMAEPPCAALNSARKGELSASSAASASARLQPSTLQPSTLQPGTHLPPPTAAASPPSPPPPSSRTSCSSGAAVATAASAAAGRLAAAEEAAAAAAAAAAALAALAAAAAAAVGEAVPWMRSSQSWSWNVVQAPSSRLNALSRFQKDAKMCWPDFVTMTIDGLISDCVPLETLTTSRKGSASSVRTPKTLDEKHT